MRCFLFRLFFGILVVLVTEGEGQELLPVAVLLFLEHVLVGIAQHNPFVADGNEQLVAGVEAVQPGQLVQSSIIHTYILVFEEFVQYGFTFFLIGFRLFAQDGGNLGAGAGGGGIHFPLRLHALRFGGQYLYLVTALQFVA